VNRDEDTAYNDDSLLPTLPTYLSMIRTTFRQEFLLSVDWDALIQCTDAVDTTGALEDMLEIATMTTVSTTTTTTTTITTTTTTITYHLCLISIAVVEVEFVNCFFDLSM
jgi:hypothetical protein